MESPEKKSRIYVPSFKENYDEQFKSRIKLYHYSNRRHEISKTIIHRSNDHRVKQTKLK